MHIISESMHRQSYKFLWDLLLDRHPHGAWARGKWEGLGQRKTDVFPHGLLVELFQKQPTTLILDEYQTWFDGLTNTKQYPWKQWAFNFVQLLSEIAKEHPELLVLVVSVRDGRTDAYQQIQRVNPALVDFKGPHAKRDRLRLLLHRLFENRLNVPTADIRDVLHAHVGEYLRLLEVPADEHDKTWSDFEESWPYAPHLMELLEDQVLVATDAQETRDLIKILAGLFKRYGDDAPLVTAADFRLDDERSAVMTLLDSVANQHHSNLRERAQRNLEAVRAAVKRPQDEVPHLSEIVGALWVRSLAVGNLAGAEPATLHVDITRHAEVDDNAFQVELDTIVENSFNIHQDGTRLVFKEEENPQAKLLANARNDKLFKEGEGTDQLAREVRYVIGGGDSVARSYRVVVLPHSWLTDPWGPLDESERPDRWDDRIPLLVLPEAPDKRDARLGGWLKQHLQSGRNTVRFLLPQEGSTNTFMDRTLVVLARAVYLASVWKVKNPAYRRLHAKYQRELRGLLERRFDRYAIIDTWDFTDPSKCVFHIESHRVQGSSIPEKIDKLVRENLFVPEDFEELVLAAAGENKSVGELLLELREPRPKGAACIPWLGETLAKERLIRLCSKGKIAINLRGQSYLQVRDGESEDSAWKRMRGRLGTGKHLDETHVLLPQAVPQTGGVVTGELFGGDDSTGDGDTSGGGGNGDGSTGTDDTSDGDPTGDSGGTTTTGGGHGGGIFGGGETLVDRTAPPNSPLNLLGKAQDEWGIMPGTQVRKFSIEVAEMTGSQLQRLLKKLPDGLTYSLSLQMEDDD